MNASPTPEPERELQSGEDEQALAWLESRVQEGLQSIEAGQVVAADEVWQCIVDGRPKA